MDRRTTAREISMQALFQLDAQGDDFLGRLDIFLRQESPDEMVLKMASKWTRECWKYLDMCDDMIKTAAIKWDTSRLSCVDRSILRLGAYQLKYCDDMPGKVVINEAIEIAKKYSGDQSPRFINGVLDAILRNLKST